MIHRKITLTVGDLMPIYEAMQKGKIEITKKDYDNIREYMRQYYTEDPNSERFEKYIHDASKLASGGDYKNAQKALDRALGIGTLAQTDYSPGAKKATSKGRFGSVYIAKMPESFPKKQAYFVRMGPMRAIILRFDGGIEADVYSPDAWQGVRSILVPEQYLSDFRLAWKNRRYAPTLRRMPSVSKTYGKTKIDSTRRPISRGSKKALPKKAVPKTAAKPAAKKPIGKTKVTRPIKKTSKKAVPKSGGKYTPIKLIKK